MDASPGLNERPKRSRVRLEVGEATLEFEGTEAELERNCPQLLDPALFLNLLEDEEEADDLEDRVNGMIDALTLRLKQFEDQTLTNTRPPGRPLGDRGTRSRPDPRRPENPPRDPRPPGRRQRVEQEKLNEAGTPATWSASTIESSTLEPKLDLMPLKGPHASRNSLALPDLPRGDSRLPPGRRFIVRRKGPGPKPQPEETKCPGYPPIPGSDSHSVPPTPNLSTSATSRTP